MHSKLVKINNNKKHFALQFIIFIVCFPIFDGVGILMQALLLLVV